MKDFTATIHNPERAAEWQAILGTTTVCIRSPIPELVDLPNYPDALIYYLDLDLLTEDQWTRLTAHLARKFGMTSEDADARMEKHGLPILADDCKVTIHNSQGWWL